VSLSSALVSTCIAERITIVFFVGKGRAFGSLVGSGMPNPLRLRAQYDLVSRPERRGTIASDVVLAKIGAMERRLQNVKEAADLRATLRDAATRAAESRDPVVLRGIEGAATRAYYTGLAMRIREPDFAFRERSRQPPRDAINSLLSFAYSLLFFEMQTALLAHGLDPHPALLHDLHRNHPALASDLIEPYRALIADSFVLTLVNDRQVTAPGFETQSGGAVYMRDDTRRTVLAAWETFITRPAGNTRGTMTPRGLIDAAALAMLAVVLGEREHLELPLVGSAVDNTHPSDGSRLDASGPRRTVEALAPVPSAPESTAPGNDVTGTDTSGPGTSGPAAVSSPAASAAPADTAVHAPVDASRGAAPGGGDDP
jgi:CRISPR-associated protein Cas1